MFDRPRGFLASACLALGLSVALPAVAEAPPPPSEVESRPATPQVNLAEALRRSLARNPTMLVALEEIRRAEALVREVRAASLPTITGNGIYTRLDADRKFGSSVIAHQDQVSANVTLTVPLIVPQRWAAWSHASASADVIRISVEDLRRQLAVAVARAFLTIIARKHVVDANEHALKTARAHFDYAHTRLLGGIGNRMDDVRAEQQVATDQATLESSYTSLARAREALGVLLGDEGPVDAVEDIRLPAAPPFATALDDSTRRRPDVAAFKAHFDAAEQVRKDSYTDYLPFLIGTIQPFYQNPESLTQPKTGWQAQLLLTIPFYDGGLRYGLARERESLSAEARAQYEGIVRQARSDVRIAFEAVKRAEAALAAAENAARLARSAVELATIAYQAGATTNLEVIDAERAAHAADTAAANAENEAGQARIDLLAASGRFP
jgi:outer membrane protein TolC